ncbi:MAG: serine/threonine protein kinase [bacterium]|nr:serine/threonine protein kinase [bacterium]
MRNKDNGEQITERMEDSRVTDRMEADDNRATDRMETDDNRATDRMEADNNRATDRMETEAKRATDRMVAGGHFSGNMAQPATAQKTQDSRRWGLKKDELVDGRFRVKEGPLGKRTGEAELFKCKDTMTGQTVALKFYHHNVLPKEDVMKQLIGLDHPDIVSLKAFGLWKGRFYEAMEYCKGGSLAEHMPFGEDELKGYLQEIINGVNYCHDQGIIHRDIKPGNLCFRLPGKKDLVITDFGISSILELDEKERKTQSLHLTPDYTAPELFSREKRVSPKSDYYALGVTLLHLFTGESPFKTLDVNAIIAAHLTEAIEIPAAISKKFRQLLKGLLQKNAANRWGYRQIQQWLRGDVVLADDGRRWQPDRYRGREFPYPGCAKAKNPRQLAALLHEFDAQLDLFRGRISQWVHHFNAGLSNRIIEIEENYTDNMPLGVIKLRYLLDPALPLDIPGVRVSSVEDLIRALQSEKKKTTKALKKGLWNTHIECWLDATQNIEKKQELLKRIKALRERLIEEGKEHLGLFVLFYMLAPGVPLKFARDIGISRLEELEDVLKSHPHLKEKAKDFIFDSVFEEWLAATSPGRVDELNFVINCKRDFEHDRELGLYALRWYLKPSLIPFPFVGREVTEPKELAAFINADDGYRQEGIKLLQNGWLRTWLAVTGKCGDPAPLDEKINEPRATWERKMENVLHLLDPDLPWPCISADTEVIALENVPNESAKTISIRFSNTGPGYLSGSFRLEGCGEKGFAIDQTSIEGNPEEVRVTVDGSGLPVGSVQRATLVAQTNGGTLEIPLSYIVSAPIARMIGRSVRAGAIAALGLGLFRFIINLIDPAYEMKAMDWIDWDKLPIAFAYIPMGIGLVLLIGGGIYYFVQRYHDS